jgi:hypothetical protein
MNAEYHESILTAQIDDLRRTLAGPGWEGSMLDRVEDFVFVKFSVGRGFEYLTRVDTRAYPIEPYWLGFIDPKAPRSDWTRLLATDARYWPWSPMPGLHGSFILAFSGLYRVFWCEPCTRPFFFYHGDRAWEPSLWPLSRVITHLRDCATRAEHPARWRPIQKPLLHGAAAQLGIPLPEGAGAGDV